MFKEVLLGPGKCLLTEMVFFVPANVYLRKCFLDPLNVSLEKCFRAKIGQDSYLFLCDAAAWMSGFMQFVPIPLN